MTCPEIFKIIDFTWHQKGKILWMRYEIFHVVCQMGVALLVVAITHLESFMNAQ